MVGVVDDRSAAAASGLPLLPLLPLSPTRLVLAAAGRSWRLAWSRRLSTVALKSIGYGELVRPVHTHT